jgi:PD-(D/E)XK endonuclease
MQVKSAYRAGKSGSYSLNAHGHEYKAYRENEIDALAAYVVPENAWYLLPVRVVKKLRSLKLFPGSRRKRSKYEKWREAWEILRGKR